MNIKYILKSGKIWISNFQKWTKCVQWVHFRFFFAQNLMSGNLYMIVDALMEPDPFIFSWVAMLDAFLETLSRLRSFFLSEQRDLELRLI